MALKLITRPAQMLKEAKLSNMYTVKHYVAYIYMELNSVQV